MFKMYAKYKGGVELYFTEKNEEECMCGIADAEEKHGECEFYSSVTDGEHFVDGEYYDYYDYENECYVVER